MGMTTPHRTGHGEKRSRKKELAAIALLSEPSIAKAATSAGIGEATLFRWMQDEDFQVIYREAKSRAVGQAISRIQQVTTLAVDTLASIMVDKKAPAMARVLAAKAVMDTAIKAVEIEDIQARLERMERMNRGEIN